ncbi:MAG TPA: hypothetical protein PL117_01740 [Accumulibacter sp.]|uniref:putative transposase n=1 Tax=Accumulibacter sp. TaxID=2053492 RepID=UPI002CE65925|nr:hypothetical protein [Accumulibacter sp.]HRD89808.1 hypothetical protein [Accumulibacter sp.]HRF71471.1 hypothetical protein [Accumulibacter sp.]
MVIAFMALARLESVEPLRTCAPGESGKRLGLDRIPEVRTLRQKTQLLSQGDQADLPHAGVSIRPTRSEPAPLKSACGMGDYQVRRWQAWHHHMALVMIATMFLAKERLAHRDTADLLSCRDLVEIMRHKLPLKIVNDKDLAASIANRATRRRCAMDSACRRQEEMPSASNCNAIRPSGIGVSHRPDPPRAAGAWRGRGSGVELLIDRGRHAQQFRLVDVARKRWPAAASCRHTVRGTCSCSQPPEAWQKHSASCRSAHPGRRRIFFGTHGRAPRKQRV